MHRSPIVLAGAVVLLAGLVAAAPASATVIYRARVSGTYSQTWTVNTEPGDCIAGGGTQTVTFASRPGVPVGGSTDTEGYDPRANSIDMTFAPFPVRGTIARTDTTGVIASDDCSDTTMAPRDCGAPRPLRLGQVALHKRRGLHRAKLHLQLTGLDDTFTRQGAATRAFAGTHACFAPDTNQEEGVAGFSVPWPTNDGIGRLHRTRRFAGSETYPADRDAPVFLPDPSGDQEVHVDVTTTFHWKVRLTAKCYRDPTRRGLRCE
jgi:hypothetical protein